jgi:hypothetical protein
MNIVAKARDLPKVYYRRFLYVVIVIAFALSVQQKQKNNFLSKPDLFTSGVLDLHEIRLKKMPSYYAQLKTQLVTVSENEVPKQRLFYAKKAVAWNWLFILSFPFFVYVVYKFYRNQFKSVYQQQDASATHTYTSTIIQFIRGKKILLTVAAIFCVHLIHQIIITAFVNGHVHLIALSILNVLSNIIYMLYAILVMANINLINSFFEFVKHLFKYNTPIVIFLLLFLFIASFNQGQNILLVLLFDIKYCCYLAMATI